MVKNLPANAGDLECGFHPRAEKVPWRRAWPHTPVFLPGESHGQKSLVGYSPWGRKESDTTEATEHTRTWKKVTNLKPAIVNSNCPFLAKHCEK